VWQAMRADDAVDAPIASTSAAEDGDGTPAPPVPQLTAATLRTALLDRLLAAMDDYSTDNRGERIPPPHPPDTWWLWVKRGGRRWELGGTKRL
jgi:hypothetical protein